MGPGKPIQLAPEMASWAVDNAALIWPMPGPDDGIDHDGSIIWTNPRYKALPLPGGNVIPDDPEERTPGADPQPQPFPLPITDLVRVLGSMGEDIGAPLQSIADNKINKRWLSASGVVGRFLLCDPSRAQPVAVGSPLFAWRGGGVPRPVDHFFSITDFDDLIAVVKLVAGAGSVREVIISLSHFEEENDLLPARYMGLGNARSLNTWRYTLDEDLKHHLLQGGTVYLQVVLHSPRERPDLTPPHLSQVGWVA